MSAGKASVRKRDAPTPDKRAVADRVARARAANPPRDPTGRYHASISELAAHTGRDVVDLLDWWDELAAIIEYDGCSDRGESERLAYEDLAAIVTRQPRLL